MSGISNLKKLLEDERLWTVAARVEVLDGEALHYFTNEEGDIVVSVRTLLHDVPLWANLDAMVGGAGRGIWMIPDPGVEVMVAFDHGEFEGEAYLVGRYTSGSAPAGLVPGQIVVAGIDVKVIGSTKVTVIAPLIEAADAEGNGAPIALHQELKSLRDTLHLHTHLYNPGPGGAIATGSGPSLSAPNGTAIFKAK